MRQSAVLRSVLLAMLALMMATLQHRLRGLNDPYADGPYDAARIAQGRSSPPFQHRLLVPAVAVAIRDRLKVDLATVALLLRAGSLGVLLLLFDRMLTRLANPDSALAGCLLLLCLLPLGFYVNPVIDSYPAMCVLVAGLWLIMRRRLWWLLPLIGFGTFIRETPILLALIGGMALWGTLPHGRLLLLTLGQVVAWGAAKAILWTLYPGRGFFFTGGFNTSHFVDAGAAAGALRLVTVFGPVLVALCGLRLRVLARLPSAMGVVGLAYAAGLLLVARVNEPRVFYEVYLLLVPAILAGVGLWGGAAERPDAADMVERRGP